MSQSYQERAKKRAKERRIGFWFKIDPPGATFRVLPTPEGEGTDEVFWERPIHRNVGPLKKKLACGKDIDGKGRCYACDKEIPRLLAAGKAGRAAALESEIEAVFQIAVVGEDGTMRGPHGFTPSKNPTDQLIAALGNERKAYADAKRGRNFTLPRTGTGMRDTKWGLLEADDDPSEVPKSILKKLKPFSDVKEILKYDEKAMKAALRGDPDPDEDDDEEEKHSMKKNKKKLKEEEEDDEEEDDEDGEEEADSDDDEESDDDDDDDDEDEKPKKKSKSSKSSKKKSSKSDDDEEDDDNLDLDDDDHEESDDEDEDEEDEKPKKKKKSVKASKKKSKSDDDDDEEDDDEEDDDEEDDDEESDDEDDDDSGDESDDEEDDEDEKPKKKSKKSPPPPPPAKKKSKK